MPCILASRFKVYAFCRLRKAQQFVHVVDEGVTAYIRFITQKAGMYTSFEGVPSAHWNPAVQSKETPQIILH